MSARPSTTPTKENPMQDNKPKPGDRIGAAGERVLVEGVLGQGTLAEAGIVDRDGDVYVESFDGSGFGAHIPATAVRPWTERSESPYIDPEFILWCAYDDADGPFADVDPYLYVGAGRWLDSDGNLYTRQGLPDRLVRVTAPVPTSDSEREL